ncbi:MAG: TIGR02266 family protein [Myxococcaceae bacterium]|nr:TIGR02266 family protein [Myxococcaceae bacterium]
MNEQATTAQASQGSDRRRSPRVALDLLIQYRFESYEAFLGDRSLDISVGGVFICTEAPREEGTLVYLQFRLKEGAPLVEGLGRVVRVNPPGVPGRVAGMGIEFVNLDDESRQTIEDIVTRRLSKAHR